jgi:hypothetical protein
MQHICAQKTDGVKALHLGHNQIKTKGMSYLSKASWTNLNLLNLCTRTTTQGEMQLEIRDASILPKPRLTTFNSSISVN